MEEYDSEDSIVESTPQKKPTLPVFQKIPSKAPKGKTEESNLLDELIKECECLALDYAVNEIDVVEDKPKAGNEQSLSQTLEKTPSPTFNKEERYLNHQESRDDSNPIYNNQNLSTLVQAIQTTNSRNCHPIHVFYTIAEVLKFNPNNFPKNSSVQVIGSLQYCPKSKAFYLELYDPDTYRIVRVKVNISKLSLKPLINEDIIVFGALTFEEKHPVIVVMFFQPFSEDYDYVKYIRMMLQLRAMMPLENYKMVSDSAEPIVSELEGCEDFFKTIVTVSEDECLRPAISDSVLNEFLDDISFEKL